MHVSLEWVRIKDGDRMLEMSDPNVRYVLRSNPVYVTIERGQKIIESYDCTVSISGLIYVEHKQVLDALIGRTLSVEGGLPNGHTFGSKGTVVKEHGAYLVKYSSNSAIYIK